MVRDMELVRRILLVIERDYNGGFARALEMPEENPREVTYHLMLLRDAGYIEAKELVGGASTGRLVWPSRLTWAGHDFIEAARNDTVWKQAWDIVKAKGGGIAVEVLKQLLVKVSTQYFLGTP